MEPIISPFYDPLELKLEQIRKILELDEKAPIVLIFGIGKEINLGNEVKGFEFSMNLRNVNPLQTKAIGQTLLNQAEQLINKINEDRHNQGDSK